MGVVVEFAAGDVLLHEVDLVSVVDHVVELADVRVVQRLQERHLPRRERQLRGT